MYTLHVRNPRTFLPLLLATLGTIQGYSGVRTGRWRHHRKLTRPESYHLADRVAADSLKMQLVTIGTGQRNLQAPCQQLSDQLIQGEQGALSENQEEPLGRR